jgi:hypothetical protein
MTCMPIMVLAWSEKPDPQGKKGQRGAITDQLEVTTTNRLATNHLPETTDPVVVGVLTSNNNTKRGRGGTKSGSLGVGHRNSSSKSHILFICQ